MEKVFGRPPSGAFLDTTRQFLKSLDLDWEEGVEFTVSLTEYGQVIATGSRQQNVLKCIGVAPGLQGEGLAATVVSELVKNAFAVGWQHLFLYTRPASAALFGTLGFYPVAATQAAVLMENRRNGIRNFVASLAPQPAAANIGAIVANCNPFTNGHLFLAQQAAAACDFVHMFILSEDRSFFSTALRIQLARQGTAHIRNLALHETGHYLVSTATFPRYFLKEKEKAGQISCELDLSIFAEHFAPALGIRCRFVGTEPFDPVTLSYNRQMKEYLPRHGIEVIEVPRVQENGAAVSASRVRALMQQGDLEQIRPLVPATTFAAIEERMQK